MRLEVSTESVAGVADAVRRAAAALAAVSLPESPPVADLAAGDAIAALLSVAGESLAACSADLRSVAVLVEVAAQDYRRVEARLSHPGSPTVPRPSAETHP